MDPVLIITHKADLDGKASGAIALRKFPEAQVISIDYGNEFPWGEIRSKRQVLMLDWSLQPFDPEMLKLDAMCDLTWIDHHSSAIEEEHQALGASLGTQQGGMYIRGVRNPDIAACELTWKYLFQAEPVPAAIHLLALYDVGDFYSDPATLPFQYGMRTANWAPASPDWNEIFSPYGDVQLAGRGVDPGPLWDILVEGKVIFHYQMYQDEVAAKAACFETEMDGLKLLAANTAGKGSMFFDSVREQHPGIDALCVFAWSPSKNAWSISLYAAREGVDVGAVCKKLGGGGHAVAAGVQLPKLPFDLQWSAR